MLNTFKTHVFLAAALAECSSSQYHVVYLVVPKGVVHIWRQMIFVFFWTPPPLIRCFISNPLLMKSDLAEPLLPPYHLTSYMDEPLPQAGHKWGFSFMWTDATWIRTDLLSIKDFWQIWQETGRSFRHVNWTCFFRLSSDFMVLWHRSQANADWFCL